MATRDHQFSVSSRCELLPYLLRIPLGLSRKQAKDPLRFRAVTVKRLTTVRHDTQLEPGDVVTIAAGKQIPTASIERHGLKIIYLDDDIVVVDKRAGLLSMGSEGEKERTAHRILNDHLKALKKSSLQQAFIVHRLDRETSLDHVRKKSRDPGGPSADLEDCHQEIPCRRGGRALQIPGDVA
jgi:23S rRNA pseudouridine1911/1915/1917 synthase